MAKRGAYATLYARSTIIEICEAYYTEQTYYNRAATGNKTGLRLAYSMYAQKKPSGFQMPPFTTVRSWWMSNAWSRTRDRAPAGRHTYLTAQQEAVLLHSIIQAARLGRPFLVETVKLKIKAVLSKQGTLTDGTARLKGWWRGFLQRANSSTEADEKLVLARRRNGKKGPLGNVITTQKRGKGLEACRMRKLSPTVLQDFAAEVNKLLANCGSGSRDCDAGACTCIAIGPLVSSL